MAAVFLFRHQMPQSFSQLVRRIGRDSTRRLAKPTKDNLIGGPLFGVCANLIEAHLHNWSLRAVVNNFLEVVVLPWLLVGCVLFVWHLVQAAEDAADTERIAFVNALGLATTRIAWHFRWRRYCVVLLYLSIPITCIYWTVRKIKAEIISATNQSPILRLQPDIAVAQPNGDFVLSLVNDGPEIENIGIHYDYFVADRENGSIVINRTVQFEDAVNAQERPLRTNQRKNIHVNFSGMTLGFYREISQAYSSLLGVRIIASFTGYEDRKSYSRLWVYGATSDGSRATIVYAPGKLQDSAAPPDRNILSLSVVASVARSNDDWVDPIVEFPSLRRKGSVPLPKLRLIVQ